MCACHLGCSPYTLCIHPRTHKFHGDSELLKMSGRGERTLTRYKVKCSCSDSIHHLCTVHTPNNYFYDDLKIEFSYFSACPRITNASLETTTALSIHSPLLTHSHFSQFTCIVINSPILIQRIARRPSMDLLF